MISAFVTRFEELDLGKAEDPKTAKGDDFESKIRYILSLKGSSKQKAQALATDLYNKNVRPPAVNGATKPALVEALTKEVVRQLKNALGQGSTGISTKQEEKGEEDGAARSADSRTPRTERGVARRSRQTRRRPGDLRGVARASPAPRRRPSPAGS